MEDRTDADASASAKREQEIEAVADVERDPDIAMAQGKEENTSPQDSTDPVDPNARETGQDYHGRDTVFTHASPQQEEQAP